MKYIPEILSQINCAKETIYRGHADTEWKVLPSIGRHYHGDWTKVVTWEREALINFKKRSVPFVKFSPKSDLEWLSLMQHHGCPTRLIDFTKNPLIALFFATDPNVDADGVFIIGKYTRVIDDPDKFDVYNVKQNWVFLPPHITERIIGQSGCFVVCSSPNKELNTRQLTRIAIPKSQKKSIRSELRELGITSSNLFPGLDGICDDLRETLVDELFWEEIFR